MDVYLVPIGGDRYELYCEVPDEPELQTDDEPAGFFTRMKQRFRAMLAEAERERRRTHVDQPPSGTFGRIKAWILRYVAESIAEQRLLWHLRGQTSVCLFFPDDVEEHRADKILRRQLGRDFEKHRFWLIVDSLGFIASGVFFFLPGPNLIAYYFAFRMVGHFLSLRGARQGLDLVHWTHERSTPLAELRRAIALDAVERDRRVQGIADALKLEHLARFVQRMAVPG